MHHNNFLYIFLKFIFDINTSKRYKNTKKINLKLKKIQKHGWTAMPNGALNEIICDPPNLFQELS